MLLPKLMRRVGWICFALMWIPFGTLIISMLGMPSGSYSFDELPLLARYSLISGGIMMPTSFVLLLGSPLTAGIENRRLGRLGRQAKAKVLQISATGTTINNNPIVRLLLQVEPADEPAFQAEAERLIPHAELPRYQAGARLIVKYDPHNHEVAVLDAGPQEDPA
jgi:hypothetical protein